MNTVQNGKGDRARNNWGAKWYLGYEAIDWHRQKGEPPRTPAPEPNPPAGSPQDEAQPQRS
ncbi:MAG TPA: hypothetical protein VMU04_00570 [Candidatus Acidoferrum sp.]|nr:hypothetical protein [Candidatus Acidoferrum sp.]